MRIILILVVFVTIHSAAVTDNRYNRNRPDKRKWNGGRQCHRLPSDSTCARRIQSSRVTYFTGERRVRAKLDGSMSASRRCRLRLRRLVCDLTFHPCDSFTGHAAVARRTHLRRRRRRRMLDKRCRNVQAVCQGQLHKWPLTCKSLYTNMYIYI